MTDRLGIYFNLPEADYHADPALGSSSVKDIYHSPCDWQWDRLHPKEAKKVKHFDVGSAVHDLVLLGNEVFLENNILSPYDNFRKKEAQAWRDETLADGKTILTKDEHEQVIAAAGAILNSPNLKSEFLKGVPEVSVFWVENGVRMKARYDYFKIRGTVDLKTFSEKFKQSLKRTVTQTIADRRYDVQAFHYQCGRRAMLDLSGKGLVHGDNIPNEEWISKACENQSPNWVWVFFKVTGAPVAFAVNPMNMPNMWDIAKRTRNRALERYSAFMEKFGDKEIWVEEIEPFVLADEDIPPWYAVD